MSINDRHFLRSTPYFRNEEERRTRQAPYFKILGDQFLKMLRRAHDQRTIRVTIERQGQILEFEGPAERRATIPERASPPSPEVNEGKLENVIAPEASP